ncbi:hypothetical protein NITHO_1040011 [Nitrolancea hollandica Lb]|uniref:Uncharacterized protein n=1 Tax=Nitrolancea hollandica Lb TaxID=1129897 RepID=I4ECH6_9BACT|nr:hypothetical protein NITHO_1040011 [Nitrolancea hollandica Lb]
MVAVWAYTSVMTFVLLKLLDLVIGFRVPEVGGDARPGYHAARGGILPALVSLLATNGCRKGSRYGSDLDRGTAEFRAPNPHLVRTFSECSNAARPARPRIRGAALRAAEAAR